MDSVGKSSQPVLSIYGSYCLKRDAPHQVSEKNEWNVWSLRTTKKFYKNCVKMYFHY